MTDWTAFREQHFPERRLNLNTGTLGTPSTDVRRALAAFAAEEIDAFPLGQYVRGREALGRAREIATRLWGRAPDAMGFGTTQLMNLLTLSLWRGRRLRVLTTLHEHEGAVRGFETHPGYEVVFLRDDERRDAFPDAVRRARPDLVLLSEITWTRGETLPIDAMCAVLRDVAPDAWRIVDAAQSIGVLARPPVAADAVVASGHKWLFGPRGTGLLWLSDRLRQHLGGLQWAGEPFDPASPGFEASGGQDFARFAGLEAALRLYEEVGPAVVEARSAQGARRLATGLAHVFRGVEHDILVGPATVSIRFPAWDPYPAYAALNARGVHLKCVKLRLHDGTALAALRAGVPYWEDRIDEAIGRIGDAVE